MTDTDTLRKAQKMAVAKAEQEGASRDEIVTHWLAFDYLNQALATLSKPEPAAVGEGDPMGHIPNQYRQGYLARERGKGRGHNPYGPMTENSRLWNDGWRAQEAGKPVYHDWPQLAASPSEAISPPDALSADAADLLEQYAGYIRTVKADDLERHPYLPEIERVAAALRADGPPDARAVVEEIKTWEQRCEEHPHHAIYNVTDEMIQARMQEEIDDLRAALQSTGASK